MEKDLFPYFGVMAPPTPPPGPSDKGKGKKSESFLVLFFKKNCVPDLRCFALTLALPGAHKPGL